MSQPLVTRSTAVLVRTLSERVRRIEGFRKAPAAERVSSGCRALDALLPDKAFRRGTLVEWLGCTMGSCAMSCGTGSGAATLALILARQAAREGGAVVVLDPLPGSEGAGSFYPPAGVALGIDLKNLILVRPGNLKDAAWALDQSLRSAAVAAVLAWPEKVSDHAFRRLQLAAESSGALGLLVRPDTVRGQPSWADLRLLVAPLAGDSRPHAAARRRIRVELLRSRGGFSAGMAEVEVDVETGRIHETRTVHLASPMAAAAPRRRRAQA